MRLAALIIPELERRFSSQRLRVLSVPDPFAIFDPVWADFGRLELHDDDDEVTAYFGTFTHSISAATREKQRSARTRRFVRRLLKFYWERSLTKSNSMATRGAVDSENIPQVRAMDGSSRAWYGGARSVVGFGLVLFPMREEHFVIRACRQSRSEFPSHQWFDQSVQTTALRSGTRENSRAFAVTSGAPWRRAWPAIMTAEGPMGMPSARRSARMCCAA